MSVFIIADHDQRDLDPSFAHVLTAALALKQSITILVLGHQCHGVAEQAASYPGIAEVWIYDAPQFEHPVAEQLAAVIVQLIRDCDYLLMASTTTGKNCLPRIAALLDVTQVSDVTAILGPDTFEHPIYAGNAVEVVQVLDQQKLLSIRTTAFAPAKKTEISCPIKATTADIPACATQFLRSEYSVSERPDLKNAKIIVSGGRGLQSKEQFKLMEELADTLGAALGASRAAVDAGFISNDHQVGQTGKVVAPMLYFAIGISGAIQHIAGIKDAQVIVAINKDENAPIFQIATYGLVGDLFELVPQLIQELQQRGLHKC